MKLNPNPVTVAAIRRQLDNNGGYCPCAPDHIGELDYKCPCKKFREQNECCCELYVAK